MWVFGSIQPPIIYGTWVHVFHGARRVGIPQPNAREPLCTDHATQQKAQGQVIAPIFTCTVTLFQFGTTRDAVGLTDCRNMTARCAGFPGVWLHRNHQQQNCSREDCLSTLYSCLVGHSLRTVCYCAGGGWPSKARSIEHLSRASDRKV